MTVTDRLALAIAVSTLASACAGSPPGSPTPSNTFAAAAPARDVLLVQIAPPGANTADQRLALLSLATGAITELGPRGYADVIGPTPDGLVVADDRFRPILVANGAARVLEAAPQIELVSPDGRRGVGACGDSRCLGAVAGGRFTPGPAVPALSAPDVSPLAWTRDRILFERDGGALLALDPVTARSSPLGMLGERDSVAVSPDGARIAWIRGDMISIAPVADLAVARHESMAAPHAECAFAGEDRVACAVDDAIVVVTVATGAMATVGRTSHVVAPAVSPDGTTLAFTAPDGSVTITTIDAPSPRTLGGGPGSVTPLVWLSAG